jgi:hypothetical protein
MAELMTWQEQRCTQCESQEFLQLVTLLAKPGAGFTQKPAGLQCAKCGQKADMAAMQRAAYLRQNRQELEAIEAEMGDVAAGVGVDAATDSLGSLKP